MRGTETKKVHEESLENFFQHVKKYQIDGQFTLVINANKERCTSVSKFEDFEESFKEHNPKTVKDALNVDRQIYIGKKMIAASAKGENYNSEYLLLNPQESHLRDLLNENEDGCVLFYSNFSPFLGTHLNPKSKIVQIRCALDMLINHKGPKAYIFNSFNEEKINSFMEFYEGLNLINTKVPLYFCKAKCFRCFTGDNKIFPYCVPEKERKSGEGHPLMAKL
ncbi:hypothetical protein NFI96_033137 [Prochilodus magdalenae]|nr:hypothetical protein NFI96_033137 [Prochilodus magdalenae]